MHPCARRSHVIATHDFRTCVLSVCIFFNILSWLYVKMLHSQVPGRTDLKHKEHKSLISNTGNNLTPPPPPPSFDLKQFLSTRYRMHKRLVINYGEGGGLQNGKILGPKLVTAPPPPSRQGKTFCVPLLESGNFSCPLYTMAKTFRLPHKNNPKTCCAPLPPLHHG